MKTIDSKLLKGAFITGVQRLNDKKDEINDLNVFPVPDGDTGTNMSMTVNSAISQVSSIDDSVEPKVLCKAISQGALMGARGNSGVILSQLFRGFYKVIKTAGDIDTFVLAEAFNKATETAYRAVMNPKEGTILTVAKAISDKAKAIYAQVEDVPAFYDELVKSGRAMLRKTPDLLPVLKQAGVVDSGGAGLIAIMEGAADYINGRQDYDASTDRVESSATVKKEYTYKVDVALRATKDIDNKSAQDLKVYLEEIGEIYLFEILTDTIDIEIETDAPGKVLTKALRIGALEKVSVINMEVAKNDIPLKEIGFVAVSIGEGIDSIFKEIGVDVTIKGGQTMNPSTDDIINAISKVHAKNVFVLPNNKNILLAANQAATLVEDKNVIIIPSTTLPQGISAMLAYIPDNTLEEIESEMKESIGYVKSGEVTYAVRDTQIDDKVIKEGDFMGIGEGKILSVNKKLEAAVMNLLKELVDEDSSVITLYYGDDTKVSDANKLTEKIRDKYPDIDVDLQMGGQPVYYYVLSVE